MTVIVMKVNDTENKVAGLIFNIYSLLQGIYQLSGDFQPKLTKVMILLH